MHTATLAPAYTLLGKLQRGLGAGFLEAVRIEPHDAHALLLSCLVEDPRREPGEARGRYYGELCLETRVPLGELAAFVEGADASPASRRLVLETVGWLAWRGIAGPIAMLREYVLGGGEETALAASYLWHPQAFAGLDQPLLDRYPTGATLADALAAAHVDVSREPWRTWSVSRHVVADALARVREPLPGPATAAPDEPRAAGDALQLVEALRVALERDDCVCAIARSIGEAAGDPFALLERAFRSVSRSSCRVTIARELSRGGAKLPSRAREWLWDAEPAVVVAALATVEATDVATTERVAHLARDGWPARAPA